MAVAAIKPNTTAHTASGNVHGSITPASSTKKASSSSSETQAAHVSSVTAVSAHGDTLHISEAARAAAASRASVGGTSLVQKVEQTIASWGKDALQFIQGAAERVAENESLGIVHETGNEPRTKAYEAGKALGDVVTSVSGAVQIFEGASMIVGGGVIAAAGTVATGGVAVEVAVPAGAAVASAGAAVAAHGAASAGKSVSNLYQDTVELFSSSNDDASARSVKGIVVHGVDTDLRTNEARGGHTLRDHVGKSEEEILAASAARGNKPYSSYLDESIAQQAVNENLHMNSDKVKDFMDNPKQMRETFVYDHGRVIGRGNEYASNVISDQTKSKVVVAKHNDGNGPFIITSYPIK
ncbi:hypothetical protein GCM10010885_19540 [Alicyclobacillus cellulosilyticus]|uniref:Bacterial CdiA-CT RNAse A domain-containing protein n=1 Tax=Alicyclobacillus cellulosilyticus TaxID=1003997 RepID=A0A917KDR3_9BACL|nr:RNase A-like domain-containing protein [Alicyclobacillus cellulosilyticus]GGJ10414.1 hypothetical protein GCM10010885_19540 [Alicyclobacillus cellulosilyticus]